MFRAVSAACVLSVLTGLGCVTVRRVGMVGSLLVIAGLVVLGSLAVMACGMRVML